MTAGPVISLEAVTKEYVSGPPWAKRHVTALKSVDLSIETGETLALVGESGSGKTTASRLCLGLIVPTSGRVTVWRCPDLVRGRMRARRAGASGNRDDEAIEATTPMQLEAPRGTRQAPWVRY